MTPPAPLPLRLCCDWWEVQGVCNIWGKMSRWSSRTCPAKAKKRCFCHCCSVGNPSSYFPVNRCHSAGREGVKRLEETVKRGSHQTQKLTSFSGWALSRGDGSCLNPATHTHTQKQVLLRLLCSAWFCMQDTNRRSSSMTDLQFCFTSTREESFLTAAERRGKTLDLCFHFKVPLTGSYSLKPGLQSWVGTS